MLNIKRFMIAIVSAIVVIAISTVVKAQGTVTLQCEFSQDNVAIGYTVEMICTAKSTNQQIDAVEIHLNFPADLLEIVGVTPGTQLPTPLANSYDNDAGTLVYAGATFSDFPEGDYEALKITFRALAAGNAAVILNTELPRKSNVTFGTSVLAQALGDDIVVGPTPTPTPPTATCENLSISPAAAPQDTTNRTVTIECPGASFDNSTTVGFGSGITSGDISIVSATQLTTSLTIAADATPGSRTVTVTTNGETVTKANGFTVQGPGVAVSLPNDATGFPGQRLNIPILLPNDTTGIYNYVLNIRVDSNVLSPVGIAKAGTLSENWTVTSNNINDDEIRVAGFSSTPLEGSGVLVYLTFDVVGAVGSETDLIFSDGAQFNEGDPVAETQNGHFTVGEQTATISGCIEYARNFSAIGGVEITYAGPSESVITTDADGCYTASLEPGNYTATLAKAGREKNGISVWDPVFIMQYVVGRREFDSHQLLACDVTGDGTCTGLDAAEIARYRIDLAPVLTDTTVGQWVFDPSSRSYPQVDSGLKFDNENYTGFVSGDVTFDWSANALARSRRAVQADAINITLPSIRTTPQARNMILPITVQNGVEQGVLGCEVTITYDPDVITITDVSQRDGVASSWALEKNLNEVGEVRIISYGTEALSEDGTLLNLSVTVHGEIGDQTALEVSHLLFNDGQPTVQSTNGQLMIDFYKDYLPLIQKN